MTTSTDKTIDIGRVAYFNRKTLKFSIARVYHVTAGEQVYYSVRFVKNDGIIENLGEDEDLEKALSNYCLRPEFNFFDIVPFYTASIFNARSVDAYDFDSEVEHG